MAYLTGEEAYLEKVHTIQKKSMEELLLLANNMVPGADTECVATAKLELYERYINGTGGICKETVETNFDEAEKWLHAIKHAETRSVRKCYKLFNEDFQERLEFTINLEKKVNENFHHAYVQGKSFGGPTDADNFKYWLEKAQQGSKFAQWKIIRCFMFGDGTEKNLSEAQSWLDKYSTNSGQKAFEQIEQQRAQIMQNYINKLSQKNSKCEQELPKYEQKLSKKDERVLQKLMKQIKK